MPNVTLDASTPSINWPKRLVPAILVHREEEAHVKAATAALCEAAHVQLDVCDGQFVTSRTWHAPASWWHEQPFSLELHLMAMHPQEIYADWRELSVLKRVIWHIESPIDHELFLAQIKQDGRETGLAISPDTPLERLLPFAQTIDHVLILGVHPGASGQRILPQVIQRVEEAQRLLPNTHLGIDGGVNAATIHLLHETRLGDYCINSALFQSEDPVSTFHTLSALL